MEGRPEEFHAMFWETFPYFLFKSDVGFRDLAESKARRDREEVCFSHSIPCRGYDGFECASVPRRRVQELFLTRGWRVDYSFRNQNQGPDS